MAKKVKAKSGFGKVLVGVALAAVSTVVAFVVTSLLDKRHALKEGEVKTSAMHQDETLMENYITLNDDEETPEEVVGSAEEAVAAKGMEEIILADDQEEDVTACIK